MMRSKPFRRAYVFWISFTVSAKWFERVNIGGRYGYVLSATLGRYTLTNILVT